MVLCTCFLCDHVIYVLKEEIAEPRRCVESDRNPYCVNFWKHPRVICHRLLITGNQFESKVQELPVLDLLFQFLPQCFMVHCRITVVDIQLQDFTCPDRVTLYPVFNHLSCSVRTFTRYASAGELVGSVLLSCPGFPRVPVFSASRFSPRPGFLGLPFPCPAAVAGFPAAGSADVSFCFDLFRCEIRKKDGNCGIRASIRPEIGAESPRLCRFRPSRIYITFCTVYL